MNNFAPKIIFFCCDWNAYTREDLADNSELKTKLNSRIIRTMCSGRIEPTFIIEAFKKGADGVMIAGCNPGDCHYNSGNYKTKRRVLMLQSKFHRRYLVITGMRSKRKALQKMGVTTLIGQAIGEFDYASTAD